MSNDLESLTEIPEPPNPQPLTNYQLIMGKPIEPINRLKIQSPEDFEQFVQEWAQGYLKKKYKLVRRSGGAGDKGRDIVAYLQEPGPTSQWDNYQCKHYDHPLSPSDIWTEIGKLCYYTYIEDFSVPVNYYFISPQGIGSTLGDLLNSPENIRKGLIDNWEKYCKNKIKRNEKIELENFFLEYINKFDFRILKHIPPLDLIEQHATTRWHVYRFGGCLSKIRPEKEKPSPEIQEYETQYVEQLLEAYRDHLRVQIPISELKNYQKIHDHFNRQRESFYCAESLKQFERDNLEDSKAFDELKEEIYDGIVEICDECHEDGFACVKAAVQEAVNLPLTCNFLVNHLKIQDRKGICHHLSNENRISWVKR
jgi:hypothetical protein